MSKILKANCIRVDSDNKINIDVPVFKAAHEDEKKEFNKVNHEINFENFDELALSDEGIDNDEYISDDAVAFDNATYEETIENAHNEANKIIDDAKAEAKNIIDDALNEAEIQKDKIFEEAKNNGYEEGIRNAEAEMQSLKEQAQQTLDDAVKEKQKIIDGIEGEMVDIIANVTQKLLNKTLNLDKDVILNLIKQALAQTTVTGEVFIRVADCDYDTVSDNKDEFLNFIDGNTNLEVVKDFSLNKGDCVIETPFGNIDCSLSQQFEGLKRNLYYILENG